MTALRSATAPVLFAALVTIAAPALVSSPLFAAEGHDNGWPRVITAEGTRVVIYQPQPEGREDTILTGVSSSLTSEANSRSTVA